MDDDVTLRNGSKDRRGGIRIGDTRLENDHENQQNLIARRSAAPSPPAPSAGWWKQFAHAA